MQRPGDAPAGEGRVGAGDRLVTGFASGAAEAARGGAEAGRGAAIRPTPVAPGSDVAHPAAFPWDEALRAGRRCLRSRPGALLLGPTGARLWADYLDPLPGFSGRFDFIHKVNLPFLFLVQARRPGPDGGRGGPPLPLEAGTVRWRPSHLHLEYAGPGLSVSEDKFISWDDCAVSCQTWTNQGEAPVVLGLDTAGGPFTGPGGEAMRLGWSIPHLSFDLDAALTVAPEGPWPEPVLAPGEARSLVVAVALGIRGLDSPQTLQARARAHTAPGGGSALGAQRRAYQAWFAQAPTFRCSEPLLERTWAYRWFLLRHNLAAPGYGRLRHPLFYEGRSHKKGKTPLAAVGWEFSKLIPLSAPLHLLDARWSRDPACGEGVLRSMLDAQDESGLFCALTVDARLHSFANFFGWAAQQWFLLHPDPVLGGEVLAALRRQLAGWRRTYGNAGDRLMTESRHSRTGKEYQPSYWYFHGFPPDPKDPATFTPLKRVDRSVYHYRNTLGAAHMAAWLQEADAAALRAEAEAIRGDILAKMWDAQTRFFYDLHHQTDEPALVKNVVGFYPAWAEMLDERHTDLIAHLLDPREFLTPCPFPSVSADCPAYARAGGWFGHFLKGRHGCMWNGPTWPYTNAIALDALAAESRRAAHRLDAAFGRCLREYAHLHFQDRDPERPGLVEHYDSGSGEPLSDEQDYNHSYWIDLVVRHVAGLSLEREAVVLDPLDIGLDAFCLDGVRAAGRELRVTFQRRGSPGGAPGYRLFVDGALVVEREDLSPARWAVPG